MCKLVTFLPLGCSSVLPGSLFFLSFFDLTSPQAELVICFTHN